MTKVAYILVDGTTGQVLQSVSVPQRFFPRPVPAGQRMVVLGDGKAPSTTQRRVDLRKVRQKMTFTATLDDVLAARQPEIRPRSAVIELMMQQSAAVGRLDREFVRRMEDLAGPLASLHAEKRRQAEAGGGPLVADEADRLAILENAARQDAALAALETKRRAIKAAIRAAATAGEIDAALAAVSHDEKGSGL